MREKKDRVKNVEYNVWIDLANTLLGLSVGMTFVVFCLIFIKANTIFFREIGNFYLPFVSLGIMIIFAKIFSIDWISPFLFFKRGS